MVNKDFP